jgi:hypothetical protein
MSGILRMLAVYVIGLSLICTALADDLPRMGYLSGTPVKHLVEKGYRWVTVNGPYAGGISPRSQFGSTKNYPPFCYLNEPNSICSKRAIRSFRGPCGSGYAGPS